MAVFIGGRSRNIIKTLLLITISMILISCGSTDKVRIAKKAEGPKELYVSIPTNEFGIALDLKEFLKQKGYKVVLNIEEGQKDIIRKNPDETTEVFKNATFSQHRYELVIQYSKIENRYYSLNSMIRDRQENEIIATYQWEWDRMFSPPTFLDLMEMIHSKFLQTTFE